MKKQFWGLNIVQFVLKIRTNQGQSYSTYNKRSQFDSAATIAT